MVWAGAVVSALGWRSLTSCKLLLRPHYLPHGIALGWLFPSPSPPASLHLSYFVGLITWQEAKARHTSAGSREWERADCPISSDNPSPPLHTLPDKKQKWISLGNFEEGRDKQTEGNREKEREKFQPTDLFQYSYNRDSRT